MNYLKEKEENAVKEKSFKTVKDNVDVEAVNDEDVQDEIDLLNLDEETRERG